jgi:D-lactate dehydrogenase (cytochrome)
LSNLIETVAPVRREAPDPLIVESRERIAESYSDWLSDESRYGPADADRLVAPRNEEQVSSELAAAARAGVGVTISSGRTGIVGGAVPGGGTLLSLAEMKRVLGVRRVSDGRLALRVEPGLPLAELGDRLADRELGLDEAALSGEERDALTEFASDEAGFFYPPDPTEESAHVGATVATNASGARSYRYGATRKHVHALRVALTTGDVVAVERGQCTAEGRLFVMPGGREVRLPGYTMPATKNAAGYYAADGADLVDVFVGSEGTLGVVTEVELILSRAPEGILSALAFFGSDEDAVAFVKDARGDAAAANGVGAAGAEDGFPLDPLALEFFDSRSFEFLRERKAEEGRSSEIPELPEGAAAGVLFESEYTEDGLMGIYENWEAILSAHGSSMEDTWGGMEVADLKRLKDLRHSIAEQVNGVIARANARHSEIHKIGTDAAVPPGALDEMISFYRSELGGTGLRYVVFGHIGDNHLHLNIMPETPDELMAGKDLALRFARRAVELGGTVSAEHGIGRIKHEFLRIQYGDSGLAEMAAVKKAFDPACVLNRGVVFPDRLL